MRKHSAVVLGGFVNGLGLVRSIAAIGVHSYVVDTSPSIAGASFWATEVIAPDPTNREDDFIEFMIQLGKSFESKAVLFATNDIWLFPILSRKAELEAYFLYPMSDWSLIQRCLDKKLLYLMAKEKGIPQPLSFFPENTAELRSIANKISYPSIIKPLITVGFSEKLKRSRTIKLQNAGETLALAEDLDQAQMGEWKLIVQEFIVGGVDSLYTYTSYANKEADVLAWSIGHKIRQYPPESGTITSGKVVNDSNLEGIGQRFIKAINFHGISNTEFKKDAKTGEFKLIEINARPGMWNRSALVTGVNLPALAYKEVTGEKPAFRGTSQDSVVWIFLVDDFLHSIFINKKKHPKFAITVREWWKSLDGKKIDAIWSINDPFPFAVYFMRYVKNFLKKV